MSKLFYDFMGIKDTRIEFHTAGNGICNVRRRLTGGKGERRIPWCMWFRMTPSTTNPNFLFLLFLPLFLPLFLFLFSSFPLPLFLFSSFPFSSFTFSSLFSSFLFPSSPLHPSPSPLPPSSSFPPPLVTDIRSSSHEPFNPYHFMSDNTINFAQHFSQIFEPSSIQTNMVHEAKMLIAQFHFLSFPTLIQSIKHIPYCRECNQ